MSAEVQIRRIAVIGAGLAGREFALRCMRAGFAVALEDVMPEKLRRAQDAYEALGATSPSGTLRFATEVEDAVSDADLAIDFVPDELESKLEIFCLLDRMAPPRTILLTPTHALDLDDLASCTYRAERCMAVQGALSGSEAVLVRGKMTDEVTFGAVRQMLAGIGFSSISVHRQAATAAQNEQQPA